MENQRRVLTHTQQLAAAAGGQAKRADLFKLVLDTVWWRRVVYFVSLALVIMAVALPLLAQYLRIEGVTDNLNDRAGGPVGWTLGFIKGFLPGLPSPGSPPWSAPPPKRPLSSSAFSQASGSAGSFRAASATARANNADAGGWDGA